MSEDRVVKTTLFIDEHGAVKAVHAVGEESGRTEHKLGGLDKQIKTVGRSFGGLKSMIGYGLGAIGVGGLAFGLKDVISKTGELAEETHKFHSITGIGEQSSLDYTAALKARGIGAEAGGNAFKFLAKNIQQAERQEYTYGLAQGKAAAKHKIATGLLGVQAKAFATLGIDLTKFSHLSEQAKFELVTKRFEGMKDGAEKTRLALQLFGRGGTALLPVLDKGALGLNHFDQMAKRFFPTLKGGGHELEELQEKQAESKMAWEGLEFTLGTQLVPAVTSVEGWFSKLAVSIEQGHGGWGTLETDATKVVGVSKEVWQWFEKNTTVAKALAYALGTVFAVQKISNFVNAVKGLALVKGLSGILGGGAATTGGEVGAAAGVGAGPYLAIGAAALFAAHELHLFGENLANTTAADKRAHEGKLPGHVALEGIRAREILAHPWAAVHTRGGAQEIAGLSAFNREWIAKQFMKREHLPAMEGESAAQNRQLKDELVAAARRLGGGPRPVQHIHVHLGHGAGQEIATAILNDPRASRTVGEAVTRDALKQKARR